MIFILSLFALLNLCFEFQNFEWFFQRFRFYIYVLWKIVLNWMSWNSYIFLIFLSLIFTFYVTLQQCFCSPQRLKTVITGLYYGVYVAVDTEFLLCKGIYTNELISMRLDIGGKFENIPEEGGDKIEDFILRFKLWLISPHCCIWDKS